MMDTEGASWVLKSFVFVHTVICGMGKSEYSYIDPFLFETIDCFFKIQILLQEKQKESLILNKNHNSSIYIPQKSSTLLKSSPDS